MNVQDQVLRLNLLQGPQVPSTEERKIGVGKRCLAQILFILVMCG